MTAILKATCVASLGEHLASEPSEAPPEILKDAVKPAK